MIAVLEKLDAAQGFEQIIDFLSGSYIHHALTVNPEVYISCIKQFWNTAVVKRSGVICLPNDEIFAGLARMGYEKPSTKLTFYKAFFSTQWTFFHLHDSTFLECQKNFMERCMSAKRTSWNEFSSSMASAGRQAESQAKIYKIDLDHANKVLSIQEDESEPAEVQELKFLPLHLLLLLQELLLLLVEEGKERRVGKGFSGVETPLFENMLAIRAVDAEEEVQVPAQDDVVQEHVIEEIATEVVPPTPASPSPSSPVIPSIPPHQSPSPPQSQAAKGSSQLIQQVLEKCSALVLRVEGLETSNAAQQLEIIKLKARVKKLEMLNKGRMSFDMETDEGVELEVDQEKNAEVLSMQEDTEVQEVVEVVTTAKLITEVVTAAATQVAAASTPIPTAKPKILKIDAAALAVSTRRRKGVVIRDPEEELHIYTPAETPTVKDKGKGILIEDPKPMKKKDQIEMDVEYAKKLQEELEKGHKEAYKHIDWNAAFDHNTEGFKMEFFKGKTYDQILPIFQARFDANMKFLFKTREEIEKEDEEMIKSINETPTQKAEKRRKLGEEAQEANDLRGRLEIVPEEDDDVFVEAIPLAQKAPVVDYQVIVVDNRPRYKIIRADDTHQFYISFTTLLKNFDREELEILWRIIKDRFSTKKPTNFLNEYLLLTLKTMFRELDKQDAIWRNQKSVHGLALVKR
nr:hypothetical protein [Tanacetum cinerariifolium]